MTTPQPPARFAPPAHLDEGRRAIWNETIDRLTASGGLFRADPQVILVYVENIASHRQASQLVAQTNVLITRGDRAVENPALAVQRRCADAITRASRALGLGRATQPDPMNPGEAPGPLLPTQPADPVGGARWCDRHHQHECTHHRNKRACGCPPGVPPRPEGCCHRPAIRGIDACRHHAGVSREEAARRGQVAIARATYGTRADIGPVEGLLEEVRWSWGHVCALRRLVEEIEAAYEVPAGAEGTPGRSRLWWGEARRVTRDGDVVEQTVTAGEHVILQAYNREREHFTRVCAAAIAAGAQQQAVDLARTAGASFGRLLDAIFAALFTLPDHLAAAEGALAYREWQREQLPAVVPAAIRAWDPDAPRAGAG
jgi:P27 family predicted phage terminase small subunit